MKKLFTCFIIVCAQTAFSIEECKDLFYPEARVLTQAQLVEALLDKQIPFYFIEDGQNTLPVILANKDTIDKILPLLKQSIGLQIMSKQGWPHDHGSFRFSSYLVDAFLPGQRQVGEIHQTGLSWKTAKDSAIFLEKIADIICENCFLVSALELEKVDYYQRVLRAAIFRIPFLMGDQQIYTRQSNVLHECGGHCFEYSHSLNLKNIVSALGSRLDQVDPQSALRNEKDHLISSYLSEVRQLYIEQNYEKEDQLSDALLTHPQLQDKIDQIFSEQWSFQNRILFLRWLVGRDAALQMDAVIQALGYSGKGTKPFSVSKSQRASALIIWDSNARSEDFLSGKYNGRGQTFKIPSGRAP